MKKTLTVVVVGMVLLALSAPLLAQNTITVPAGTTLTVRLRQTLSSKTSKTGQSFSATVTNSVSVGGKTAIPAGSLAHGRVLDAKKQGAFKGAADLALALTSVTVNGKSYAISTGEWEQAVKGKGKRTAAVIGGGAAGGAIIGALAGGGKGAAIGAGVGAGAGTAVAGGTGGKNVNLPAESALSFRLTQPVSVATQ